MIWKLFENCQPRWEFSWDSVQWFMPTNLNLLSRPHEVMTTLKILFIHDEWFMINLQILVDPKPGPALMLRLLFWRHNWSCLKEGLGLSRVILEVTTYYTAGIGWAVSRLQSIKIFYFAKCKVATTWTWLCFGNTLLGIQPCNSGTININRISDIVTVWAGHVPTFAWYVSPGQ